MKQYLGLLCAAALLAGPAGTAWAQASVTYYNQTQSQMPMQVEENDNQVQRAVDSALADYYTSRAERDAALAKENEDEEEPEKVYRYDKKDTLFNGAAVPPRLFNNIPYPY